MTDQKREYCVRMERYVPEGVDVFVKATSPEEAMDIAMRLEHAGKIKWDKFGYGTKDLKVELVKDMSVSAGMGKIVWRNSKQS